MTEIFLKIEDLVKHFPVRAGVFSKQVAEVHAVDGVSFDIVRGETMGLVGESGCGKTTLGRCVLRLIEPTSGRILYSGRDLLRAGKGELKALRKEMSMIFQDPFSSLNPRMTIAEIVGEPFDIHGVTGGSERESRVKALMKDVGLSPYHIYRYPHEFSGGQKQRIAIARALALNPKFVVADEPVAALDVSVRVSILNLMSELQERFGLTYLFITHDLSAVRYMCDRVLIMYLGRIIEVAEVDEIFESPLHPYTKGLISAVPIPDPTVKMERIVLRGEVPSPINPPSGCRFHPRCPYAMEVCSRDDPCFRDASKGHAVACHLYQT